MRKYKWFLGVAVLGLALSILGFNGCNRHRTPEERIAHKMQHIDYHLDLTEHQRGKLNEVKDEILRVRNATRNEHQVIINTVIDQFGSEQIDQATVLDLLDRHHALMKEAALPTGFLFRRPLRRTRYTTSSSVLSLAKAAAPALIEETTKNSPSGEN